MPTYNGAMHLKQAFESALGQTFVDFELLVVDDNSTDETVNIVQEYAKHDSRVKVFCNRARLGLAKNWNRCLDLASGEWIKFLFQDDHIAPRCVEELYRLGSEAKVGLVACDRGFVFGSDVSNDFRGEFLRYVAKHNLRSALQNRQVVDGVTFSNYVARDPLHNCIGEPTATLFRRSDAREVGGFNADMIQIVDWEFWVRLVANTGIAHVRDELAVFRLHGSGMTIKNRLESNYKASAIDHLIIIHELNYNKYWENVRAAARAQGLDYKHQVFCHYENARQVANMNPSLLPIWQQTIASYPKLARLPVTFMPYRIGRRVRHYSSFFRRLSGTWAGDC